MRFLTQRRAVLVCAPALLAACSLSAPAADDPPAEAASTPITASAVQKAKAADYRFHSARATGIRFPVLRSGVLVEERHFDPSLPAHKFRHSISLSTETGTVVTIDAWDNPERLDLRAWFDAHLGFLAEDAQTQVRERPMTRDKVAGILVEHTPVASAPETTAVFALAGQVFRVTGTDLENDATGRALFDRVIEQMEPEVTR